MDLETAMLRLKSFVGIRYDAKVVAAFVAACESGKIRPGVLRINRNQRDYVPTQPFVTSTPDSVIAVS